jgi:hypothetical protein
MNWEQKYIFEFIMNHYTNFIYHYIYIQKFYNNKIYITYVNDIVQLLYTCFPEEIVLDFNTNK